MNTPCLADEMRVPRGVICAVGGGGKTSLLNRLAEELSARGRVLRLTTTHIVAPSTGLVLLSPTPEALSKAFEQSPLVTVGEDNGDGRLRVPACPLEPLEALADYVLIEADGSRQLPVKAAAGHEPALPGNEALVIAVAGMSALGRPIAQAAHRPERYAALVGKPQSALITPGDMARVLTHAEGGQRKGVKGRFAVVLNQCDDETRLLHAREAAEFIPYDCFFTAFQSRPDFLESRRLPC